MSTQISIGTRDGVLSGRRTDPTASSRQDVRPLLIALHGGSYSSQFFDVPGYSLLERAAEAGCAAVALDRPGYRGSTLVRVREGLLEANAERLSDGIEKLWMQQDHGARGVVLIGHSIGAVIAILLAAQPRPWPLLGIALSGIGLIVPPGGPAYEAEDAPQERLEVPSDLKNSLMFGPPGSYAEDAPGKAATANEPVVYREIIEINTWWPRHALEICARVRVPVHYRQGELDAVWSRGDTEVTRFRNALANAATVDARLVEGVAHSIDFHHSGRAFQEEQIAFGIACARTWAADSAR